MASIDFDGVSKRFPNGTLAVDDMNLTVSDGEFMIFVGPSGCGKTTALRMVAGLEEVTSGSIRIGDRVVNDIEPPDRDIAMVFQNYALYPHMSVEDNMSFPLRMQRVSRGDVRARVRAALKRAVKESWDLPENAVLQVGDEICSEVSDVAVPYRMNPDGSLAPVLSA